LPAFRVGRVGKRCAGQRALRGENDAPVTDGPRRAATARAGRSATYRLPGKASGCAPNRACQRPNFPPSAADSAGFMQPLHTAATDGRTNQGGGWVQIEDGQAVFRRACPPSGWAGGKRAAVQSLKMRPDALPNAPRRPRPAAAAGNITHPRHHGGTNSKK
jgi:hypothetical protein